MATYVVGDLQGYLTPLERLLQKIKFNSDCDQLWFTGDLINRGPTSLQTLEFVYAMRDNCITVLGNHDLMLLRVAIAGIESIHTCQDILQSPRRDILLSWLIQQPLLYVNPYFNTCLVHAGIYPTWNLNQAQELARKVESVLNSSKAKDFLAVMFGDHPKFWHPTENNEFDHLRFIVNVLTRMRYLDDNQHLDLKSKLAIKNTPNLIPWFTKLDPSFDNTTILFGHWSTLNMIQVKSNIYNLDTGYVWGGKLTALKLETHEIIQIDHCNSESAGIE